MLKCSKFYASDKVIPGESTLCLKIADCPFTCQKCKNKEEEEGVDLTEENLATLLRASESFSAVCFMGGDKEPWSINELASQVRRSGLDLKIGWYSCDSDLSVFIYRKNFDFIKIGKYKRNRGELSSKKTNQKFYKVEADGSLRNQTHQFWIR